jgi:uncharacterized RDD family membrane protein YckC
MSEALGRPDRVSYAGFWWRVWASLIDGVISSLLILVVAFLVGIALSISVHDDAALQGVGEILGVVGGFLYFACFESSRLRATPGKLACSLRVVDENGDRIGFWRATGRYFGKILSALILGIGFMMAGWTHRRQALHDKLAGCLVIRLRPADERLAVPAE